jgi:hypothetical protein
MRLMMRWNRYAAQVLHEVEATATDALAVQRLNCFFIEGLVDVGNAAIRTTALRDGINDGVVVNTMAAGIHKHGAAQPQDALQAFEIVQTSIGWRVAAISGVRVLVARSKDVAMRIGGILRQLEFRRFGVRIWWITRLGHGEVLMTMGG